MISMGQLQGHSLERAALYGMPHIGARYVGEGDRTKIDEGALCPFCGKPAENAHHAAPKGLGGGGRVRVMRTEWGWFPLRSALVAVCGRGNASGCHGGLHSGLLCVRWEWDAPEDGELWESGWLLSHGVEPHSPALYGRGRWVLSDGRSETEIREDR